MTGNQTTILLLVALLALVFWLYNSKKLGGVVSAVTGSAGNPGGIASSGSSGSGNVLDTFPSLGTLRIVGNGTSPLPIVNTSAIANARMFIHYDPATNSVSYSENP